MKRTEASTKIGNEPATNGRAVPAAIDLLSQYVTVNKTKVIANKPTKAKKRYREV